MAEWVVGYDGSKGAEAALAWTVETALATGDDVRLVTVVDTEYPGAPGESAHPTGGGGSVADARQMLDRAAARYAHAGVTIIPQPLPGPTVVESLIDTAVGTQGLVVGSRGLGRLRRLLTGSVTRKVVDGALSTVVIVPERPADEAPRNAVVVGVDGSTGSQPAVHAGAWMAQLADAELEAVTVAPPPDMTGGKLSARSALDAYLWSGMPSSSVEALGAEVERERDQAFSWWRSAGEQLIDRQVARLAPQERPDKISRNIVKGRSPGRELLRTAEWASLLVIGRSGHTGLPGLLLGSVSRHCALNPPCPVMIVP
jgi:nucleotide-binding universal stress UspA family protein